MLVGAMRAPQDRARASELRALAHAAPAGGRWAARRRFGACSGWPHLRDTILWQFDARPRPSHRPPHHPLLCSPNRAARTLA